MKYCLVVVVILLAQISSAQSPGADKAAIEKAIEERNTALADTLLQKAIDFYSKSRQPDSLNTLIFYVGRSVQLKSNTDNAVQAVETFIRKIKSLSPGPVTLAQSYADAAEFFGSAGKNKLAYDILQQGVQVLLAMPDQKQAHPGPFETSMGTYANRMGDVNLAQQHYRRAVEYFERDASPRFESLYTAYNGMGGIMYYASKLDSAQYFYGKAIQALEKATPAPINQFYRPAVIQNNLSGIYSIQGKTTDAIRAMKTCIDLLKKFIVSKEPDTKKTTAITFQFEATDNLGGIYKELGDFRQAHELLFYSYQQKQKHLAPDDPAIFISQILLGQLYYAMREYDKSLSFLSEGLQRIEKSDGSYLFWHADACYTMAQLNDKKGNPQSAALFYEKADSLYDASLQGSYDNIYLQFLNNAALFHARNNKTAIALATANKAYQYVLKTEGQESLLGFNQLLSLSEVHFAAGNYREALAYSETSLKVLNKIMRGGSSLLDSIKMELKKPEAILLKVKSAYELLDERNATALNSLLGELDQALNILEKRKSILRDPQDISTLMANQSELLDFVKKLTLELYQITGSETWSDRLISLHESGIYNRIRFRLEKSGKLQFAYLPADTEEKEQKLKQAITDALSATGSHDQRLETYIRAIDDWNRYLEQLRSQFPHYYTMRYASIFKSVQEIQSAIPESVTVVRYFFVGEDLMALVTDRTQKHLVQLTPSSLEKMIVELSLASINEKRTLEILARLYEQLWAPLADFVRNHKLVIIPDGILYNLSFDLLTPEKINAYKELATKSLLAKYRISYRYSLLLLNVQAGKNKLSKNFVAFAPGFSDKMKTQYRYANQDTSQLDNNYLSLLPQPFTISLATRMQEQLGGNSFVYDESTVEAFRSNAGKHKIIHIGTHAESDNMHPEFSRVIFAKDTSNDESANSLYLFDIYNCELTSDLAVLSACETGKPGYQDGEGMVSLAHAFNYAGCQSIVTGLWKIDEQSSAIIMEQFYKNLLAGMEKDEALRNAKLDYLSKSSGRMLAPQYWAGLVLMGDTSSIEIDRPDNFAWVIAALLLLVITGGYYILTRSKNRNSTKK